MRNIADEARATRLRMRIKELEETLAKVRDWNFTHYGYERSSLMKSIKEMVRVVVDLIGDGKDGEG